MAKTKTVALTPAELKAQTKDLKFALTQQHAVVKALINEEKGSDAQLAKAKKEAHAGVTEAEKHLAAAKKKHDVAVTAAEKVHASVFKTLEKKKAAARIGLDKLEAKLAALHPKTEEAPV